MDYFPHTSGVKESGGHRFGRAAGDQSVDAERYRYLGGKALAGLLCAPAGTPRSDGWQKVKKIDLQKSKCCLLKCRTRGVMCLLHTTACPIRRVLRYLGRGGGVRDHRNLSPPPSRQEEHTEENNRTARCCCCHARFNFQPSLIRFLSSLTPPSRPPPP